jgi:2-iminobutanoate/2-iminopropanoate deaminase
MHRPISTPISQRCWRRQRGRSRGRRGALGPWRLASLSATLVSFARSSTSVFASMDKESINPPTVFRSLDHGFSQAVAATGRRTLYLSGQVAWDSQKQLIGGASLEGQAGQAFQNLQHVVEAAGGTLADVVAVRIYIVDYRPETAAAVSSVFRRFFTDAVKPAATWVGVATLAEPRFLIEVEAVAVLD